MASGKKAKTLFDHTDFFMVGSEECDRIIDFYFEGVDFYNKKVLDAGCRFGEFTEAFARRGALVVGIDYNTDCIQRAKELNPERSGQFHVANLLDISEFESDAFDYVFCLGVMPYIPEKSRLTVHESFSRLLRDGGEMLVVYQRKRSTLMQAIASFLTMLPNPVYRFLNAQLGCSLLYPIHGVIMGRKLSFAQFKYVFGYSLKGLRFGYPDELIAFETETPSEGQVGPKTSISFRMGKGELDLKR